jgi:hypothetical protein
MSATLTRLLPLACAATLALASGPLHAQQLIAPTSPVASFSQPYLYAQFSQWEFSFPAATSPLLDQTGAYAGSGDQGRYFFLAGSLTGDPLVRSVTVRADQKLLISPISILYWTDPVFDTEAKMREDALNVLGVVTNLSVTIDGLPALMPAGYTSLDQFRQSAPLFPFTLVEGNITGYAPGVFPAIVEGYFMALDALPIGNHQLRFTALATSVGPYEGYSFAQDITYNITSVPEASTWAMMGLGLVAISAGALRRQRG